MSCVTDETGCSFHYAANNPCASVGSELHWVVTIPAGGSRRKRVPSVKSDQSQFLCSKLESAPAKAQRRGTTDMKQKLTALGRFQAAIHTPLSRVLVRSATCAVCSKLKKFQARSVSAGDSGITHHPGPLDIMVAERIRAPACDRAKQAPSWSVSRHLGCHTTGGDGEIRTIFPAGVV